VARQAKTFINTERGSETHKVWPKLTWQELERTAIEAAVRRALIENLDLLTATLLELTEMLFCWGME